MEPIDTFHTDLGRVITHLRVMKIMTRSQLAERSRLTVKHINQLEEGLQSPTVRTLIKLSVALETSPAQILRTAQTHNKDRSVRAAFFRDDPRFYR